MSYRLLHREQNIKIQPAILQFYLLFCIGLKLDISLYEGNVNGMCFRIKCWGENLDLRNVKLQEN